MFPSTPLRGEITLPSSERIMGFKNSIMSSFSSVAASVGISTDRLHIKEDKEPAFYLDILNELGLIGENSQRDEIYKNFEDVAKETNEASISLERFVMDMCMRGHTALWADAAFRAVDKNEAGRLSKYEYLFAVLILQPDDIMLDNPRWLQLRQNAVFAYYDKLGKGYVTKDDFYDFLNDASVAQVDAEMFGISNKDWRHSIKKDKSSDDCGMDQFALGQVSQSTLIATLTRFGRLTDPIVSLSQALALSKVEIAQKQHEFEELQMAYLKLEKRMCALKLELAAVKATVDR